MLKKRLEILITEDEFLLLKEKARESNCSIGELVRESIQEKYYTDKDGSASKALNRITSGQYALDKTLTCEDIERIIAEEIER